MRPSWLAVPADVTDASDYTRRILRTLCLSAALAAALTLLGAAPAAAAPVPWCGNQAASDRLPDAVAGFEWHVIYAFPSDGADRFGLVAPGIAGDLASIDAWWNGQDPSRRIRFDLHVFPDCAPGFGQLDLSRVQLPRPSGVYRGLFGRLEAIVGDLNAPPFGFASVDKKYLVYYDGPVDEEKVCGQGNSGLVEGGPDAFAVVFMQACGQGNPGDGEGVAAITAVHEMVHTFNALPSPFPSPGPPNVCPSDQGHPCDSALDLLYPEGKAADTLSTRVLDAGRDDYYGHGGAWFDVQDSPFLLRIGGPDALPPAGPSRLSATSTGPIVTLSWPSARDDAGPLRYRVYRDGRLLRETSGVSTDDRARTGQTVVYAVRAADDAGNFGPLVEVRFKVGTGIVDAAGRLVRDTVPPPRVTGLRGRGEADGDLALRWNPARDPGGIRGYLVERNGRRYATVTRTAVTVPRAKARGTWSVRAIDRAGNVGPRFQTLRVG